MALPDPACKPLGVGDLDQNVAAATPAASTVVGDVPDLEFDLGDVAADVPDDGANGLVGDVGSVVEFHRSLISNRPQPVKPQSSG